MYLPLLRDSLLWFALLQSCYGQSYHGPTDPRINIELTLNVPCNGVSTTPSGKLFLVLARVDGSTGPQVVEYDRTTNTSTAYPNKEWNSYEPGKNPATHFLGVNSQRIGPDGQLWIVDKGATALGSPVDLPYGPKVVVVDTETNKVTRVYHMGNVTRTNSLLDDIRFNPAEGTAYLTDAGSPGLIVLNLATGMAQRVLDGDPSTSDDMPVSAEGHDLSIDGHPAYIYADQLEVSPDAKWFYYQPASGGMSRIQTKYLNQASTNSSLNSVSVLGLLRQPFANTPSTGGTAIDADGNIYVSDTDSQRIIKTSANGTKTLLTQDPRLLWVDAMWITADKKLWMPAAQLNRGTPFNGGKSYIVKPLHVYSIDIGVGPSPIDHGGQTYGPWE